MFKSNSNKILVPIDFNEHSVDIALNYAIMLAKKFNLEINLLHVIEESGFFSRFFSSEDNEKIASQVEEKLKELAFNISRKRNIEITPMVTRGKIASKIDEVANLLDVAFVVVGASNHSDDSDEKTLGAQTHKLIRISNRPILVVRNPDFRPDIQNILLPIDLVPATRQIVPHVVELAQLSFSKITLAGGVWDDTDNKEMEHKTEFLLNQVQEYILNNGLECKTVFWNNLSSGKEFQKKLCEYGQSSEMDLIVALGRSEESPDYFISSNTLHLVSCSPIPVISIIPKERGITFATGRI